MSYLFIFGVQISWGIQMRATPNFNQNWTTGMHDFLRTRAVDRTILFWSKLTVHFAFCSFVWIALAAPQLLQQSPMQVRLYDNAEDQQLKAELLGVPAFQAKVVSDNGKGRVVIDVEKGARIMAGFTGVKVTLVTLLTLWFFAALRWSMRRMMIVILTFFAAWM
ncbi:MAG TPA: hypothetical protein VNB29_09465, partial [Chthoniobacterales bacterium]|nr:hypothetical protein [Chthoniobacterales bacterium]